MKEVTGVLYHRDEREEADSGGGGGGGLQYPPLARRLHNFYFKFSTVFFHFIFINKLKLL